METAQNSCIQTSVYRDLPFSAAIEIRDDGACNSLDRSAMALIGPII